MPTPNRDRHVHVRRTDLSTLRPVERREDGTIVADARLTKCGVFSYLQPDGSVRRELRRREDVCKPESLRTLVGRPVTNNHPPGLLDAKTARGWAVGAQAGDVGVEEDHVRSKVSVYDADTISAMDAGKVEVSCGYECDCLETPGEDPQYGRYDAIQKNIKYNHIAIVDHGRAGPTAAVRMDGWMVPDGTPLASPTVACNPRSMAKGKKPTRRTDDGVADPDDEAGRSARGANDAPAVPKVPPTEGVERDDDEPDEGEGEGDEEVDMDAYSVSCDDDGNLTDAARDRMKAKNFAVPDQERLPIHDKPHVRAAMSRFGDTSFADADEKHAAFNRIAGRAKEFGVSTTGFEKAHGAKLDRASGPRSDTSMTAEEIKKLQAKSEERKTQRNEARLRADAAEAKSKELEGKLAGLQGQLEVAAGKLEDAKKSHLDSAAIDKIVADRAELVATAVGVGAQVTAAMAPVEIKRAVIKHLDKKDVPADKHVEYVEALYQGALERHRADAAATQAGAGALAAARGAGGANTPTVVEPVLPTAALPTESEVAARLRTDSINGWAKPGNATALRGGY